MIFNKIFQEALEYLLCAGDFNEENFTCYYYY